MLERNCKYNLVSHQKFFWGVKMKYRVIAKNRVFYEGKSLNHAEKILQKISQMILAGFSTDFKLKEFEIITIVDSE